MGAHCFDRRGILPLDEARVLVQTGIRLLQQRVDDIHDAPPLDLDVVGVVQPRRILGSELSRRFEHAAGQLEQPFCILIEASRDSGMDGPLELEVLVREGVDGPRNRDQRGLDDVPQRLELLRRVHGDGGAGVSNLAA
jgi:hypothetical protein